jgi:triosephosphate isomerase
LTAIKSLVAGNWKMNGLGASLEELVALRQALEARPLAEADVMICPPATLLSRAADVLAGSSIALGAQDCSPLPSGAHTGDISAEMLADAGATAIIVGHSERRIDHGETDALINEKAQAACQAGLTAIICVGETETHYRAGETLDVLRGQLEGSVPEAATAETTVIAYEPVWAIGTGRTATPAQAQEVHLAIRSRLETLFGKEAADTVRILYGGSVKPNNIDELRAEADIDGALVGGASLDAASFTRICGYERRTRES